MTDEQIESLKEFEDEELLEELRNRGVDLSEDCDCSLRDYSDRELRDELNDRNDQATEDVAELFSMSAVESWLRAANPPQEVRDAYWRCIGRIL